MVKETVLCVWELFALMCSGLIVFSRLAKYFCIDILEIENQESYGWSSTTLAIQCSKIGRGKGGAPTKASKDTAAKPQDLSSIPGT